MAVPDCTYATSANFDRFGSQAWRTGSRDFPPAYRIGVASIHGAEDADRRPQGVVLVLRPARHSGHLDARPFARAPGRTYNPAMPRRLKWTPLVACLVLVVVPAPGAAAPKSVLFLTQSEPSYPSFVEESSTIRSVLAAVPGGMTYHIEHLAGSRYGGLHVAEGQREWLRSKYDGVHLDLILASGPGAIRFLLDNPALWPGVPVVFFELVATFENVPSVPGITGTFLVLDVAGTVRLARRLFPDTRTVALIAGASPRERAGCPVMADVIRRQDGAEVLDLCGLPMGELSHRLATLPPDAIALFLTLFVDGAGATFVPAEAVAALSRVANRPIFVVQGTHVGRGPVGGVVVDYALVGKDAGELALRVLSGEDPARIPPRTGDTNRTLLDARALERWEVAPALVPPGAEVLFGEPSVWERHGRWILGGMAALAAQALVIVGLLLERRRRREASRAAVRAKELQDQIAHLNRISSLGQLSGAIAHELGQPLTAIRNNAHSTLTLLDRGMTGGAMFRAGVTDIVKDSQRAADVLGHMRAYLRRDTAAPFPVSLASVADETARLVRAVAAKRQVDVRVENADELPPVMGDEVQLVQVALNLATNAIESAAEGAGERQVTIRTSRSERGIELGVEDTGPGISPAAVARLFEPFFTTKSGGLGMGLAICRTIVEAHGGRLWVEHAEPGRTEFRLSLPQVA